jgi:hypothetical protein
MGPVRRHIRNNVVGYIAIFLFAIGGTAYATHPGGLNTISSDDIINGAVRSADVGNDSLESQDVRDETSPGGGLQSQDLRPGSVGSSEVVDGSLTGVDVTDGSLDATDVSDTSTLGTAEIDESSLFNDNSLDAGDISNSSTLGAAEINEAGLAQVPSANNALTLTFNDVRDISSTADNGAGFFGFSNLSDLNLDSTCASATGDLNLVASTDVNNASFAVSDDDSYFDVEDFDIADGDVDILTPLGGDSDEIINLVYVNGSGFTSLDVVTAQLHILDQAPAGTQSECIIAGHAFISKRT